MTKVLVVDDDVEGAETLALLLNLSGHEVHVAHDGRQALDIWHAHRHSVVFLDLEMPVLDGFDVAKSIRDIQEFDAPLVVALTGRGREVVPLTKACGFDFHMQKPADAVSLVAAVKRVEEDAAARHQSARDRTLATVS